LCWTFRIFLNLLFQIVSLFFDNCVSIDYILLRINFAILFVLFLLSLLTIFKAPTSKLWLVQVVVGEYSIIFIGITLLVLLFDVYSLIEIVFGIFAIVLYFSPIVKAYLIARKLPNDLEKAFGNKSQLKFVPFSIFKLLKTIPEVRYRTFTYVTYEEISLKLDYYNTNVKGKRPCVIVIHGGSWIHGDSQQLSELNSYLSLNGYNVAAINYRLAPKWKYPSAIEDTSAALKYLRDHADELNIDIENFVLVGRSAGGQIAALSGYTLKDMGIKGVIDFYGPVDMIWGYMTPTNPLVSDSHETLVTYLGGDYNEMPERYASSSPIECVNEQTIPTLMIHGKIDALVFDEHARRLAKKLTIHQVRNYFLEIPWGTHGLDYHLNSPSGQLSTYSIQYFLNIITN